jgi:hypothetical protein
MCAINRASIYVLLSIMTNLSALIFQLVTAIFWGQKKNKTSLKVLPTVVPIILLIIGYSLEGFSFFHLTSRPYTLELRP